MDHDRTELGVDDAELVVEPRTAESATETVVRSVAAMEGVDETDLDPLSEHVDIDAVRAILRHAEQRDNAVRIRFTVEGYTVSVGPDETVRVIGGP